MEGGSGTNAAGTETSGGKTASGGVKTPGRPAGPRKVKLTVSKVDPWSVMKLSFLLSVALGIAMVVATFVIWVVLDRAGVFDTISTALSEIAGGESSASQTITSMFELGRVISIATVLAIVDIILITAISTLVSLLYNLGSTLVGGLGLTLTDD
nr:DUF3566 domain-containing protein [Spelaeicoccus albus]